MTQTDPKNQTTLSQSQADVRETNLETAAAQLLATRVKLYGESQDTYTVRERVATKKLISDFHLAYNNVSVNQGLHSDDTYNAIKSTLDVFAKYKITETDNDLGNFVKELQGDFTNIKNQKAARHK